MPLHAFESRNSNPVEMRTHAESFHIRSRMSHHGIPLGVEDGGPLLYRRFLGCFSAEWNPSKLGRWNSVVTVLAHRLRRWPNIVETLFERLAFAGIHAHRGSDNGDCE